MLAEIHHLEIYVGYADKHLRLETHAVVMFSIVISSGNAWATKSGVTQRSGHVYELQIY
jgi:hypothetical protein